MNTDLEEYASRPGAGVSPCTETASERVDDISVSDNEGADGAHKVDCGEHTECVGCIWAG